MKQLSVLIALALLVCSGCSKKTSPATSSTGTYKGVIIKNACCLIVIHSIGSNLLGQDWTDNGSTGNIRYDHAFKVANPCQFGNHVEGDTISFNVVKPQAQNCACCMMFTTTPDTAYSIEVVK
ncbi:MAG: hypothetical protein JWQ38_3105 [Flavipsychrobacter sp.]|nr:hypothetical protein [Flavipsychrobacter sp.]